MPSLQPRLRRTNRHPLDSIARKPTQSTPPLSLHLLQRSQHEPASLNSGDILQLQGIIGNQAATRLLNQKGLERKGGPETIIQRDDDPLEEDLLDLDPDSSWTREHNIKDKSKAMRFDTQVAKSKKRAQQAKRKLDHGQQYSVEKAWLSLSPQAAKESIGARFPNGPMLNEDELEAIFALSEGEFGPKWLHAAGLMTIGEARDYIDKGVYLDFQLLHRPSKMLLAHVAWYEKRDQAGNTPPFWLARSILAGEDEDLKEDINRDLMENWAKTLGIRDVNREAEVAIEQGAVRDPTDKTKVLDVDDVRTQHANATEVLRKVLVILQAGLKVYDKENKQFIDFQDGPVVKALSHGGRVNIRIPKLAKTKVTKKGFFGGKRKKGEVAPGTPGAYALTDWLGITRNGEVNEEGGAFLRAFGTHYVGMGKDKEYRQGTMTEKGGKLAALSGKINPDVFLFGLNLSVGGLGEKDFNGDVILPDGGHGHMFIGFRKPTFKKDGVLQIGIETTGPHAPSTVGYIHNMFSSEKTANPISSSGGLKKDKVGDKPGKGNLNARMVDLNDLQRFGSTWLDNLNQLSEGFGEDYNRLVGPREMQQNNDDWLNTPLEEPELIDF